MIFALSFFSQGDAQQKDTLQKKLFVKANALFLPVGVLNAGLEYQLNNKMTVQGDIFISPWKSFAGKYAQVYMAGLDGRYYFKEAFKHWYIGVIFRLRAIKSKSGITGVVYFNINQNLRFTTALISIRLAFLFFSAQL